MAKISKGAKTTNAPYTLWELMQKPRFWLIYLGCLEKPRSLKELSQEYGYKTKAGKTAPNLYQPNIDQKMIKAKALMYKPDYPSKEHKYLSNIKIMTQLQPMINIFNKSWAREGLMSLDKIMILFCDKDGIKREGHHFIGILKAALLEFIIAGIIKEESKDQASAKSTLALVKTLNSSWWSFTNIRYSDYFMIINPVLKKHEKEIKKMSLQLKENKKSVRL